MIIFMYRIYRKLAMILIGKACVNKYKQLDWITEDFSRMDAGTEMFLLNRVSTLSIQTNRTVSTIVYYCYTSVVSAPF